jgi:hypothetical protein
MTIQRGDYERKDAKNCNTAKVYADAGHFYKFGDLPPPNFTKP